MSMGRLTTIGVVMTVAAAVVGCKSAPAPTPPPVERPLYAGPLHPVSQVVSVLSTRSAGLRTLWARHEFAVATRDNRGRLRTLDGEGVMLLRKPAPGSVAGTPTELRLTGSKDIAGQVFDLGVNRQVAWLTLQGDIDTMWTLPMPAPGQAPVAVDPATLPVRPDLVPDLLGVQDWSTDLNRYPTPVMTYDPATDEYLLTLVEPPPRAATVGESAAGGLITRRQLRLERTTLLVRSITFYGADGRPVATSLLSDWKQVEGLPGGTLVPGDVQIALPLSRTTLRFTLREMTPSRGSGRSMVPSDASFRAPAKPPVGTVIDLATQPAR